MAAAQKAAIAYINSTGGINGHPLVANQCDDQDQANVAATCAAAAVRSSDVAIVGGTEVFPGFFSTVNTAKLTFTGGLGLIPQELTSPVSFPVTSVAAGWYFGSGALAVKLGAKKVTIVQCSIPACEGTAQESAAALKIAGDSTPPQFVTFQLGQAISATDAQQDRRLGEQARGASRRAPGEAAEDAGAARRRSPAGAPPAPRRAW